MILVKNTSIILGLIAVMALLVLSGCKASPAVDLDAIGSFKGCYEDDGDRDLDGYDFKSEEMTNELCVMTCKEKGFRYAATEHADECYCGNTYGKYGMADDADCDDPCAGDPDSMCGGYWRESVYGIK
ncbi:WSC domain-containing protein [Candidatus Woesearchaeota archaeon]|nr:WSC domain-containing protein [Candidatus Woesearchaeota archaeon]